VRLLNEYDIVAGKMFSKCNEDFTQMLTVAHQLDGDRLRQRLCDVQIADEELRKEADHRWYVLTGERFSHLSP
jgi:hypothetical protein